MNKIIKINESQLKKIISRIINEQNNNTNYDGDLQNVKNHFIKHYSNRDTIMKFKNKDNIKKILSLIPRFKLKLWNKNDSPNQNSNGWVNFNSPFLINLNSWKFTGNVKAYNTILHEMAHLIDNIMTKLGEDSITTNTTPLTSPQNGQDSYVANERETLARIQNLRSTLGIGPVDNPQMVMSKFINAIKTKKMTFGDYRIGKVNNFLVFQKPEGEKGVLSDLWSFYSVLRINNVKFSDIPALFATFSILKDNKVYLDISKIANININTKGLNK
jgi:hypothetical protein